MKLIKLLIIITIILNGLTYLPDTCNEATESCEDEYFRNLKCGTKIDFGEEKTDYAVFHVYEPKWKVLWGDARLMRIQERMKGEKVKKSWLAQRKELEHLDHPNLLKFVHHQIEQLGWYEVLEFPTGKTFLTLYNKDRNIFKDPTTILNLFKQIVESVDYLHQKGFVHRFLDAEFILYDITKNEIKIMNHDLMQSIKDDTIIGTHFRYWPPETMAAHDKYVDSGVKSNDMMYNFNREFDCYGLGIILYYLTQNLKLPFWKEQEDDFLYHKDILIQKNTKTDFEKGIFKIDDSTDAVIAYLMNGLMLANPKERWSTKKALKYIEYVLMFNFPGTSIKLRKMSLYSMISSPTSGFGYIDTDLGILDDNNTKKETRQDII